MSVHTSGQQWSYHGIHAVPQQKIHRVEGSWGRASLGGGGKGMLGRVWRFPDTFPVRGGSSWGPKLCQPAEDVAGVPSVFSQLLQPGNGASSSCPPAAGADAAASQQ